MRHGVFVVALIAFALALAGWRGGTVEVTVYSDVATVGVEVDLEQ